ncbi:MAG: restriction endonuclease [Ruminococcus sp.]|nr:restriction endonuclease [Ruminococcus sp.]MBR1752868.1 restriction endonuclease [Ruminococcus sp.]
MNKLSRWLLHQGEFADECDIYEGHENDYVVETYEKSSQNSNHIERKHIKAAKRFFSKHRIIKLNYFFEIQDICPENLCNVLLQTLCEKNLVSIGQDGYIRYLLKDHRTLTEKVNRELTYIDSLSSNGYLFEEYISKLLVRVGFLRAYTTPRSNDYGADIIAELNGYRYAIQCKCYSKPVGNKAVQEVLASLNYYHADIGAVITNNRFTENAKNLARANNIQLWDRTSITEWLYSAIKQPDFQLMSDFQSPRASANTKYISNYRVKNKYVSFFLCLFLGEFGAHKFYEGKASEGILYLCTFGIFGFGWLIDMIILLFFKPNPYYV